VKRFGKMPYRAATDGVGGEGGDGRYIQTHLNIQT